MSIHCNVCHSALSVPLFSPKGETSLSSLGELIKGQAKVFFCEVCGHLQTQEVQNIDEYYDKQYKILIDSEDEDQLYKIEGDNKIYRYDYQAEVALSKLTLGPNANVLEYGAAKGATLKRILQKRPDLTGYAFDVSEMYIPFWDEFIPRNQQATYTAPSEWEGSMDYILSFYVLEHVAALKEVMLNIHSLLKDGGKLYFIIPNTYENIADFVVADHVNHFSTESLTKLMTSFGFENISIDVRTHESAFIVTGSKSSAPVQNSSSDNIAALKTDAEEIAHYWQNIANKINNFEKRSDSNHVAIYGAGFYGSFIYSHLLQPSKVSFFVDQNIHLQGKRQFDVPIVSAQDLPSTVDTLFVGLNPKHAKRIIANLPAISEKQLNTLFL